MPLPQPRPRPAGRAAAPRPSPADLLDLLDGPGLAAAAAAGRRVRRHAAAEVAPGAAARWEGARFEEARVRALGRLRLGAGRQSEAAEGVVVAELAKADPSVSLSYLVHRICARCIAQVGTPEQRQKFLPGLDAMDKLGCFALTEPLHGSDAGGIETTAEPRRGGGWRLNGTKRWVGNGACADVAVVLARNAQTGEVNGFIVEPRRAAETWEATVMAGKAAMRGVHNAEIRLRDVLVDADARLPFDDFSGVAECLASSRLLVAWQAAGICFAALDAAVRYALEREQFGAPLAGHQLVAEKLARIAGSAHAAALVALRAAQQSEAGALAAADASLAKAWASRACLESCRLARDVFGGAGLLLENRVAMLLADAEAIYTYEGTYDINQLVVARHLTGVSAVRPGPSARL